MKIVVTGSAGHLGEALMRSLRADGVEALGLDLRPSPYTDVVASITDAAVVAEALRGAGAVLHTATLHKPHIATHRRQQFIDTNISGTLTLLEAAVAAGVGAFVFTSTTSAFGHALRPPPGAPAAWIDETVTPVPKNIYGVTKLAAEALCALIHERHGLPCLVLRTGRFFPEDDDAAAVRRQYSADNAKVNELLNRRADLADLVDAHRLAITRAPALGFGRYVLSATTPFQRDDAAELARDAAAVIRARVPAAATVYAERGWQLPAQLDRVYDNRRAREALGWQPRHDFASAVAALAAGGDYRSALAVAVGAKGYHAPGALAGWAGDGPFPVEPGD